MAEDSVGREQHMPDPLPIAAEVIDTLAADPVGLKSAAAHDDTSDDLEASAADISAADGAKDATAKDATAKDATAKDATASDTVTADSPVAAQNPTTESETETSSPASSVDVDSSATNGQTDDGDDDAPVTIVEKAIAKDSATEETDSEGLPEAVVSNEPATDAVATDVTVDAVASSLDSEDAFGRGDSDSGDSDSTSDTDAVTVTQPRADVTSGSASVNDADAANEASGPDADAPEIASTEIASTEIADLQRLLAQSQMREHALKTSLSDMQATISEQQQHIAQLRASTEKMATLQQELSEAKDYIRRLSQQTSPSAQAPRTAPAPASRPLASQGRPLVPNPPMRPGITPWSKAASPRPSQRPAPASRVPSATVSLPPMSTETGTGLSTIPNVVPPQRPKQTPKKRSGLQRYTRPGTPSSRPAKSSEVQPSQPQQGEAQQKLTDADIGWFD